VRPCVSSSSLPGWTICGEAAGLGGTGGLGRLMALEHPLDGRVIHPELCQHRSDLLVPGEREQHVARLNAFAAVVEGARRGDHEQPAQPGAGTDSDPLLEAVPAWWT